MLTSILLPFLAALPAGLLPIQEDDWSPPPPPPVVPSPLLVQPRFAPFVLPDAVRIVAAEPGLERQELLLQDTLEKRIGRRIPLGTRPVKAGDLLLTLGYLAEPVAENPEGYSIEVFDDHVALSGSNATGVARAIARLAQLFQYDPEQDAWTLPPVRIDDGPTSARRGLMVDVARFSPSVESVREAVETAFLFSLNAVHLHVPDGPDSPSPAGGGDVEYSKSDLEFLALYAADRGIALVAGSHTSTGCDWGPANQEERAGAAGAQISVRESRAEAIVPAVLRLAPELAERMWGSHATPSSHADFEPLARRMRGIVKDMLRPVRLDWKSDLGGRRLLFENRLEVSFGTGPHAAPGRIRYIASEHFGAKPTAESTAAPDEPLVLDKSTVIAAALFDENGRRISGVTQVRFEMGTPVLRFDAYRLPKGGEFAPLAFDGLTPAALIGRGELMARVRTRGHVDMRPTSWAEFGPEGQAMDPARPQVWEPHAVLARGQVAIDGPGVWTLEFRSRGGIGRVTLGEATATCASEDELVRREAKLEAGTYSFCIEYAVLDGPGDLEVWLTRAGQTPKSPLSERLRPLAIPAADADLLHLDSFQD